MTEYFSNGYAVIVGVGADLPVTMADANAVADLLVDKTRCAYPKENVHVLTGEEASRKKILSSLEWLENTVGEDDTVIVYFSGHGIKTPDYHLLPFGYDLDNLAETAISGDEFTQRLRLIQAKKLIVLLDCCHAGGLAEAKGNVQQSPLPAKNISELGDSRGRVVIASSRADELSWTGKKYSQFTQAVLEGLAGYGASEPDGFARILDITMWLGRVVPERTRDKQHPIIKVSDLQDNFAMAWYAGGEKTVTPLTWLESSSPVDNWLGSLPSSHTLEPDKQTAHWLKLLEIHTENLLLIEERMAEFSEFASIPLDLVKNKRAKETAIADLKTKLRMR